MNSGSKFWTNQAAFEANENHTEQLANFFGTKFAEESRKFKRKHQEEQLLSNRF